MEALAEESEAKVDEGQHWAEVRTAVTAVGAVGVETGSAAVTAEEKVVAEKEAVRGTLVAVAMAAGSEVVETVAAMVEAGWAADSEEEKAAGVEASSVALEVDWEEV